MADIGYLETGDGRPPRLPPPHGPRPDPDLPARLRVRHGRRQGERARRLGGGARAGRCCASIMPAAARSGGDFESADAARLARRRAGDDRRGRRRAGGAGRLVDGRLADAARRARPAGAGRRPGRHRRRARFHRLGLHRRAEDDDPRAKAGSSSPTPMATRPMSPPAPSGRAARRCGCSHGEIAHRLPGAPAPRPGRRRRALDLVAATSPAASVQPTCRRCSSRTATIACRAIPTSRC